MNKNFINNFEITCLPNSIKKYINNKIIWELCLFYPLIQNRTPDNFFSLKFFIDRYYKLSNSKDQNHIIQVEKNPFINFMLISFMNMLEESKCTTKSYDKKIFFPLSLLDKKIKNSFATIESNFVKIIQILGINEFNNNISEEKLEEVKKNFNHVRSEYKCDDCKGTWDILYKELSDFLKVNVYANHD